MIRLRSIWQTSEIRTIISKDKFYFQPFAEQVRKSSRFTTKDGREEAVVVSDDGNVVVCWHPEPKFPYECSRPLPLETKEENVLKFKFDENMKDTFRKIHPYFESKQLREMTYTTKHIWFPSKDRKLIKFKKKMPRDREYL
ncbi:UNVERIFIED_CONTAM: hypothetical protein RMT77_014234 [Armadillidium vulgare]